MASMASAIRKAAILVSSLDIQSADNLLDQMGEQLAAQVRAAIMSLGEVPPEVQQAVVEEFFKAQGRSGAPATRAKASEADSDVELVLSSQGAKSSPPPHPVAKTQPVPQLASSEGPRKAPFEFLVNTPIATLATYLQREHVQTIAVVVDQLSPERAAKVLEFFSPQLQLQVVRRMAALEEADLDALSAISAALENSIGPLPAPPVREGSRIQSLRAVIDRIEVGQRSRLLERVGETDYDLAAALVPPGDGGLQESRTLPDETAEAVRQPSVGQSPPPRTVRLADLASVSDAVLATVLREAPAHWVLLALAGGEQPLLERLQRMMPAKQWAGLQQRLRGLGPYRLSDIAAAHRGLAEIAGRLAKPADRKPLRAEKIAV